MALEQFGLVKTTLLDYPGEVGAAIFTPGCNLRCPYCHNPYLVAPPYPADLVTREEVLTHLRKRAGVLQAVCITGGEPLMHQDLAEVIAICKQLGYKVKIDTNGSFPNQLAALLDSSGTRPDYIALDIKTAPSKYSIVEADGGAGEDRTAAFVLQAAQIIKNSRVMHEFRTTVVPGIVEKEDIQGMIPLLQGARLHYLVPFRPGQTLDPAYGELEPHPMHVLESMREEITSHGIPCRIRR